MYVILHCLVGSVFACLGHNCADDVDECQQSHSPCTNGGTCLNRNGTFMCICMNGWTGPTCDINIDDCIGNPCKYGGTCEDRVGSYLCKCPVNKTGEKKDLFYTYQSSVWTCLPKMQP